MIERLKQFAANHAPQGIGAHEAQALHALAVEQAQPLGEEARRQLQLVLTEYQGHFTTAGARELRRLSGLALPDVGPVFTPRPSWERYGVRDGAAVLGQLAVQGDPVEVHFFAECVTLEPSLLGPLVLAGLAWLSVDPRGSQDLQTGEWCPVFHLTLSLQGGLAALSEQLDALVRAAPSRAEALARLRACNLDPRERALVEAVAAQVTR